MADRLVVHIGDFKTGSTSIQRSLAQMRQQPGAQVFYPGQAPSHARLVRVIRSGRAGKGTQQRFRRLARDITRAPAPVAVLSAEHFQMVSPADLAAWLDRWLPDLAAEAQIICYVRPHAEFLISTWAEQTKLGVNHATLESFVPRFLGARAMTYHARFSAWQACFGARFSLRPMIRATLQNGDAVQDFFGQLDLPDLILPQVSPQSNTSLPFEDVEFLRRFHRVLRNSARHRMKPQARNQLGNRLQAALQTSPLQQAHKITLTPAELDQVRGQCLADAQAMDAQFFDGSPLATALSGADRLVAPRPDLHRAVRLRHLRALVRTAPRLSGLAVKLALTQGV